MANIKICAIDSQNLVNGSNLMTYNTNLALWDSVLPKLQDGTQMFQECSNLKSFNPSKVERLEFGVLTNLKDASYMFSHSGLETFSCMYLPVLEKSYKMFEGCSSLTDVGITVGWNGEDLTPHLKDTRYMFEGCENLKTAFVYADLSKLRNTSYMFNNCKKLERITCYGLFDQSYDTFGMFDCCYKLQYVDSYFRATKDMGNMFRNCKSLKSFNRGGTDMGAVVVSPVTRASYAFENCYSLPSANLRTPSLTNASRMFKNSTIKYCYMYDGVGIDCNCTSMFDGCSSMTMFRSNLSNAKTCDYMFRGCSSLTNLMDVADGHNDTNDMIDISNCTSAKYMFAYCYKLSTHDGDNIKIVANNLAKSQGMFKQSPQSGWNCSYIDFVKTIRKPVSAAEYDITNGDYMFQHCNGLLGVHGMNSATLVSANYMFEGCYDIGWSGGCFNYGDGDFSSLVVASYMFHNTRGFLFSSSKNCSIPNLEICRDMFSTQASIASPETLPSLRVWVDVYPNKITNLWNVVHGRSIDDELTLEFITKIAQVSTSSCAGQTLGTIYIPLMTFGADYYTQYLISLGWGCKSNDSNDGTYYTDTLEYYCLDGHAVEITVIHKGSHLPLNNTNDISTANGYCPDAYKNGSGWNTKVLPNITVKRIINGIGYDD